MKPVRISDAEYTQMVKRVSGKAAPKSVTPFDMKEPEKTMFVPHPDRVIHRHGRTIDPDARKPQPKPKPAKVNVPDVMVMAPGDVLFREGDMADCAYYVETGELEIRVQSPDALEAGRQCCGGMGGTTQNNQTLDSNNFGTLVNTVHKGEVLGEMAVIQESVRCATARAKTYCSVRILPKSTVQGLVDRANPGMRALLETLFVRLKATNHRVVTQG